MRGRIEGIQARAAARQQWAERHVPDYIAGEVAPLVPLLSRIDDLVLIDVGANKGFYSKAFLRHFSGRVRKVYMLDPSHENFRELTNKDDNLIFDTADHALLEAYNAAAGSAVAVGTLHTDEDGSPMASLYPHEISGRDGALMMGDDSGGIRSVALDRRIPVAITTIDVFVRERALEQVDLLKIDTEGHEYAVLLGAKQTLDAGKIDIVFFEFGNHQVEARNFFIDFWKFFESVGFEMFHCLHGKLHPILKYSYMYENFSGTFTFAARRRGAARRSVSNFNEADYLAANPDVRAAVDAGAVVSGLEHWLTWGEFEGRRLR